MPAAELIANPARIGYHVVEMAPEELYAQIVDGGWKIITTGGHQSLGDGLNKRENHDRIEKEVDKNLALAVKWGIPASIVLSGNRNGLSDAAGLEITAGGDRRKCPK